MCCFCFTKDLHANGTFFVFEGSAKIYDAQLHVNVQMNQLPIFKASDVCFLRIMYYNYRYYSRDSVYLKNHMKSILKTGNTWFKLSEMIQL